MTQLLENLIQETGKPGKVKTKGNSARALKASPVSKHKKKAASVAAGSSEVMVKISSYGKGGAHVKAHLMYISRHSMASAEKVALENDKGQLFDNIDDVKELYEHWSKEIDVNKSPGKGVNQRDTMHMVLSMPGKADPLALRGAVRAFAADNFGANHEYVFALHTDTDNDHCHLVVKCRGFDGRQVRTSPERLQHWRESFAERLRERGIDAEATPRPVRGVVRRPEKQVLRHIDNPAPEGRAPRQSRVMQSRIEEAEAALQAEAAGRRPDVTAWEGAARAWQGKTKAEWLGVAKDLRNRPTALKTKDGKELTNEPINYSRIDRLGARTGQLRAAAIAGIARGGKQGGGNASADLHKPGDREFGARGQALAVPGLRDMPAGNVVRDQRGAAVFLRANSRHRLDDGRSADIEMRRAGTRVATDAGSGRPLSLAERNLDLAKRIEAFVARLPEPLTARQALQRQLRAKAEAGRTVQHDGQSQQPKAQGIPNEKDKGRSR